jgi:hypothetical protein
MLVTNFLGEKYFMEKINETETRDEMNLRSRVEAIKAGLVGGFSFRPFSK